MSALGHKRTSELSRLMSALCQKQTCEQHSQLLGREGMDETFRSFLLIVAINRPYERNHSLGTDKQDHLRTDAQ